MSEEVERFINESYDIAKAGFKHDFMSMMFHTSFVLTGVGAPIHIFLQDVATMLGTSAILPKHHEVANALGAVGGNVYATNVVEIRPNNDANGTTGYTVYGNTATKVFKLLEDAEIFATKEAERGAHLEAVKRGAQGEITTTCKLDTQEAEARDCIVYLGTRVIAHAVGSIGL